MDDYINRADVLKERQTFAALGIPDLVDAVLIEDIEAIPPTDVRPVVLCRDCVHFTAFSVFNTDGTGKCGLRGKCSVDCLVDEEDFCSSGERREGGADE